MPISLYLHIDRLVVLADPPISFDLDHVVRNFRSLGRHDFDRMAELVEKLASWLRGRVQEAQRIDDFSRDFPTVRFYDDAVVAWLDEIQVGALAPPVSFWEHLKRAGRGFVHGLARIPESVHESQIIPRFLDQVNAALEVVLKSIDRFLVPSAETFDPSTKHASDLFGELGLLARVALTSRPRIESFLKEELAPALSVLKQEGDPNATSLDLPETLDALTRNLVGGILIFAELPTLIKSLWDEVSISVRGQALAQFKRQELAVYGLRRQIIDLFYNEETGMLGLVKRGSSLLIAAKDVLGLMVDFWGTFLKAYIQAMLFDFHGIVQKVVDWLSDVVHWIQDKLLTSVEKLLKTDLGPVIAGILGGPLAAALPSVPRVTVLDLAKGVLSSVIGLLITQIRTLLKTLDPLDITDLDERLANLALASSIALGRTTRTFNEKPRAWTPLSLPNIYEEFFRKAGVEATAKQLGGLASSVTDNLGKILDGGARALQNASYAFDKQSAYLATGGGASLALTRLASTSAKQAEAVFGEDAKNLRESIANKPEDKVATGFEQWLAAADGGFFILGKVVPTYVAEMIAEWRRQEETGGEATVLLKPSQDPKDTSPHILAAKAQLGVSRIKMLKVTAPDRALDDALVAEIAARFRDAMTDAYYAGDDEIQRLAMAKGAP
jgi:hypothetical protein